jgi:hypothetical protein
MPNPRCPKEERDRLFQSLGWKDGAPLRRPPDVTAQLYGTFASGGYAVERQVLVNPKFDRLVAAVPSEPLR